MKQLDKVKDYMGTMPGGKKKGLLIGAGVLFAFALLLAVFLNTGQKEKSSYAVLFSGLNEQESAEVMAKLQESGVNYKYSPDGSIMVPSAMADQTRATLAVEGFPKNGFAYETFLNNSNMMSTEADKKSLKAWEMQDRLAATIRLFDGVKDAVVQIAPVETQKYVLDNSATDVPTASVMVTMKDGSSPTSDQVAGIQRLVAKSIANMDMGDVAVIDGNGIDVSVKKNDVASPVSDEKVAFEQKIESQVEDKVLNVLDVMFGKNNVRVSAKCTANMQKTISEESAYTAPNTQNNSGYITHQELSNENSGAAGTGGVPGAQANTNVPQYNTQPGATQNASSGTSNTDFALNEKKVQSQDEGGSIDDLSIAVSINAANLTIGKNELMDMVGRAAGIDPTVQAQKIVIVNSEWPQTTLTDESVTAVTPPVPVKKSWKDYLPYLIGGGVLLLIFLILIVVLSIRRAKKKKARARLEIVNRPVVAEKPVIPSLNAKEKVEIPVVVDEKSKEMRDNIRGFTEDNPEISAQLLKNWLRGGEDRV